jgi:predicted nucleotidyltransferase
MTQQTPFSHTLPSEFLTKLLNQWDDETVTAIILHGSYARGDARPPYSDVDIVRITRETPKRTQKKRFLWYEGYLLNLSSRPLSIYREWLTIPQEAIFRVSTIRDAQILIDKDGAFCAFQQQTRESWTWEPLQMAANAYAGQLLSNLSEVILRTLGAVQFHRTTMLIERIYLHILPAVTEAVSVQRGIVATGNTYLDQIQEHVGLDSAWTRSYREAVGVQCDEQTPPSLEQRGLAALRLYQETVRLLESHLLPDHLQTIEPLVNMINQVLHKNIT